MPLVVRLSGTNVEEGMKILAESGLDITTAETLAEAAEKVVAAWKNASEQSGGKSDGDPHRQRDSKVLVTGITGRIGSFHAQDMINTAPTSWAA